MQNKFNKKQIYPKQTISKLGREDEEIATKLNGGEEL